MFFFWPTINEHTLSGDRTAAKLDEIEKRMDEFLAAKRNAASNPVIERVARERDAVRSEKWGRQNRGLKTASGAFGQRAA